MTLPQELSGNLGRYRIIRKLGVGGMGTVYLAEDTRLPRKVALKVPHFTAAEGNALERFRREAALASGIEHPNLCPVHDLEEINGILFFTMPFLEGTPLSRLIEKGRPWPIKQAVEVMEKVAAAVAHLHARGIIHRDLKPSNVMIRPSGEAVVMDLGLARDFTSHDTRMTATGTVLGSPAYMAPEQVLGQHDLGAAVDVYGLGMLLFELLTGRLPFETPAPAVYAEILHSSPPPPSSINPTLDHRLDTVCLKALAKEPAARQKSVEEFLHDLRTALAAPATGPQDPNATQSEDSGRRASNIPAHQSGGTTVTDDARLIEHRATRRRRTNWLIACGLLLLAGTSVVWFFVSGRNVPEKKEDAPGQSSKDPARAKAPFDAKSAKELQQAWAGYLGRPVEEEYDLGDNVKLAVVLIPPGTFKMGAKNEIVPPGPIEEDQHEVTLTRPFYLGKYEVTQEQFEKLMKFTPSRFRKGGQDQDAVAGLDTKRFPVENVLWEDAVKCCEVLGRKLKNKGTLPSEAQWEYACRAGTETPFHFGSALNGTEANCNGDSPYGTVKRGKNLKRTCEIGLYPANAWGLHDMHGNVSEWCADYYGPYEGLPEKDPLRTDWVDEAARVVRGGSWNDQCVYLRAAGRVKGRPGFRNQNVGFRVCFVLD